VRVAFDAGPLLDPPTGVGRYADELARALEAQDVELLRYAVALGLRRGRSGHIDGVSRWRVPARVAQALWRRFDAPAITRLTGPVDVVHGTNFVLPALGGTPGVVTVHDLSFLRSDVFPGGERLRALVPWSVRRAARVIVPTRAVAEEVSQELKVPQELITVTYEGVSPVFFGAAPLGETVLGRMGIPGPFAVAVGTIEPRKNLSTLLEAWRRARRELGGWRLVLAGPRGWGEELPETEGVMPIGWVGAETLPGLLAAAEVFCYPSVYEGFGLPPLEAMAAGTPALVGRYSAADEVFGEAAILVDPHDADGFAEGLVRLATNGSLRASLQLAGRARASSYTWERTAKATLGAYRTL
jgi:glycosyltransferase involved in cell wall biosynthesis